MNTVVRVLHVLAATSTFAVGVVLVAVLQFAVPTSASDEALVVRPSDNPGPVAPAKPEFSCYDLNILPIWHELKMDSKFGSWTRDAVGTHDCANMLEIKRVDLNFEGDDEIMARGKDFPLCGNGRTGCGIWVFEKRNGRYQILLSSTDSADTSDMGRLIRRSRTRGYSDLLLKAFGTSYETIYATYSFNGRDYVESRCVYEVPKHDDRNEGSWELVECEEYSRRFDN